MEHEERKNEKPSNSHIPEGARNPRKKSNSVLFPCPSVCRWEHHCRGLCVNVKIRNLKSHRSNHSVRFAQQLPFGKIKSAFLGAGCLFLCVCVCMCTHTHRGVCGAECASASSSIFNIFKILNENVAVNFKLIWMDSNKMQTSLQIRIFSEDF